MGAFRKICRLRNLALRKMGALLTLSWLFKSRFLADFYPRSVQKSVEKSSISPAKAGYARCLIFGAACLISGCAPSSLEDLRCQADAEMKGLLVELRGIETKEDLQKSAKKLKKYFQHIASLLVEARKFSNMESETSSVGEELFAEFARIYEIPGAREAVEQLQAEAVYVLRKKSYADPS